MNFVDIINKMAEEAKRNLKISEEYKDWCQHMVSHPYERPEWFFDVQKGKMSAHQHLNKFKEEFYYD